MKGYVHSVESFSTLDGPGIRSVVFLQGCPLRCQYCHNPDTWQMNEGNLVDSAEVIARVLKNKNYIARNGGVTISGGEPTAQIDFLAELLKGFKEAGLHTAVDTSGYVDLDDIDRIIDDTDLFIVDIKHMDPEKCRELTGRSNEKVLALLGHLENLHQAVWIRNVLLPGFTDTEKHISDLCAYVQKLQNVQNFEVLPYHALAKAKYQDLDLPYKLDGISEFDSKQLLQYQDMIQKYYSKKFSIQHDAWM
ncbi:pyruvate formate-lyase activating enzyme [Syntrophobotulus glycolicus DSM 8271]|uniref:Pyruvate formate-lyase-activating enzyme n=1 Tax=Syntrophobotulus glycolicus (strain DSM 8271 / FlGlyR) TaxID=645991 RepID=F0SUW2_SYNGF|nr:pyruvate formate-lyase-activating protein [Syntrophobotulus glycolicus]ADY56678.1 pyruvate formate-lyase activating enzyme [Syntrophobotulus glycolicus DSM 8271]